MRQTTLLWFVRFFLHQRALERGSDSAYLHRNHAKRARAEAAKQAAAHASRPSEALPATRAVAEAVLGPLL